MDFHIEKYRAFNAEDLSMYSENNPTHELKCFVDIPDHPHGRYWFIYQFPKKKVKKPRSK